MIAGTLAERLRAFGYTREDLQMIVGPDGRERPGAGRLDGHRHAAGGALRPAASCCSTISSRCSPR